MRCSSQAANPGENTLGQPVRTGPTQGKIGSRSGATSFRTWVKLGHRQARYRKSALDLLTPPAARALRADLKDVLTEVASGRASVASLLHQIERVAKYTAGKHDAALGHAKNAMQDLVKSHASYALKDAGLGGMGWDRLYCEVKDARNDIMHTGTEAVLADTRTKALAAVLLDALLDVAREDGMNESGSCTERFNLAHVMVEHPVCAHPWQTIADVRRTMLVSDFSLLPLADRSECEDPQSWRVLTADDLAAWLGTGKQRKEKMSKTLEAAGKSGLRFRRVRTERECKPVQGIWSAGEVGRLPLLVIREEHRGEGEAKASKSFVRLVGIVTAFDLL